MKVEHEAELDRNEMSMLRWVTVCGFNLKDKKKCGG